MVSDTDKTVKREGVPMFDQVDPGTWEKKFVIFLMRKDRAHTGGHAMPVLQPGGAQTLPARTLAVRHELKDWWKAQDSFYSWIMVACEDDPDALIVANTYHNLRADAVPAEQPLATELMTALRLRFLGDTQVRLEEVQGEYSTFSRESDTKVTVTVDRLKMIIQKLTQLNHAPTPASMIEKLKSTVKVKSLETLSVILAMKSANTTFEEYCDACKSYDRAILEIPNHSVNMVKKQTYTAEEKVAYAKKKAKERQKHKKTSDVRKKEKKDLSHIDCRNCGKYGHYQNQCPDGDRKQKRSRYERADDSPRVTFKQEKRTRSISALRKSKSKGLDWSRRGVMDEDEMKEEEEDGFESNMIGALDSDDDDEDTPTAKRDALGTRNKRRRNRGKHKKSREVSAAPQVSQGQEEDSDSSMPSLIDDDSSDDESSAMSDPIQYPIQLRLWQSRLERICAEISAEAMEMIDSDGERGDGDDSNPEILMSIKSPTKSGEKIYLDSCASKGLLIIKNANQLDEMDYTSGAINLTKKGASMTTQGIGCKGSWKGITVCEESVKNICAVDRLKRAGYGLVQLAEDQIVDLETQESVLICQNNNGMPWVYLSDLLALPDRSC
jgi:hypothetical protein